MYPVVVKIPPSSSSSQCCWTSQPPLSFSLPSWHLLPSSLSLRCSSSPPPPPSTAVSGWSQPGPVSYHHTRPRPQLSVHPQPHLSSPPPPPVDHGCHDHTSSSPIGHRQTYMYSPEGVSPSSSPEGVSPSSSPHVLQ